MILLERIFLRGEYRSEAFQHVRGFPVSEGLTKCPKVYSLQVNKITNGHF